MRRAPIALLSLLAALSAACPDRSFQDAEALEREGKLEEAGQAYVALAKRDPANLGAWDRAIDVWCRQQVNVNQCMGVLDLELDLLGNLQRHREALAEVLEARARARITQGFTTDALADLDRAEKASPQRAGIYVARARVLMMQGDGETAYEALKRALELDPQDKEAAQLFAEIPHDTATATQTEEKFGGAGQD